MTFSCGVGRDDYYLSSSIARQNSSATVALGLCRTQIEAQKFSLRRLCHEMGLETSSSRQLERSAAARLSHIAPGCLAVGRRYVTKRTDEQDAAGHLLAFPVSYRHEAVSRPPGIVLEVRYPYSE